MVTNSVDVAQRIARSFYLRLWAFESSHPHNCRRSPPDQAPLSYRGQAGSIPADDT